MGSTLDPTVQVETETGDIMEHALPIPSKLSPLSSNHILLYLQSQVLPDCDVTISLKPIFD